MGGAKDRAVPVVSWSHYWAPSVTRLWQSDLGTCFCNSYLGSYQWPQGRFTTFTSIWLHGLAWSVFFLQEWNGVSLLQYRLPLVHGFSDTLGSFGCGSKQCLVQSEVSILLVRERHITKRAGTNRFGHCSVETT